MPIEGRYTVNSLSAHVRRATRLGAMALVVACAMAALPRAEAAPPGPHPGPRRRVGRLWRQRPRSSASRGKWTTPRFPTPASSSGIS